MVEILYKDDGSTSIIILDCPLFEEPKIIRHDEYENWVIDGIVRDHLQSKDSYRAPRPHELAEMFPDAKPILNAQKKELTAKLNDLLQQDRDTKNKYMAVKDRGTLDFVLAMNEMQRQRYLEQKKHIETILSFMTTKGGGTAIQDFQLALKRAKDYPIENLMEFKHRKAPCLWHDDKDPSLYYYPKDNRVQCFVCDKGWDSVDVVMKQRNCTLREAIAFLNPH